MILLQQVKSLKEHYPLTNSKWKNFITLALIHCTEFIQRKQFIFRYLDLTLPSYVITFWVKLMQRFFELAELEKVRFTNNGF